MSIFSIQFKQHHYQCRSDETVLQAFLRQGVEVSFSCRKGSCQVCMMCCESGDIPPDAQKNIQSEYIEKGYFLPCCCYPVSDMRLSEISASDLYNSAIVYEKEYLSDDVCRLLIEPAQVPAYRAGQYFNLRRVSDGLARSYSAVSHVDDYFIEFHIKKMPNGSFSNWVFEHLNAGDQIDYQGPMGNCSYSRVASATGNIFLAARGTGLAPVLGVARDALRNHYAGNIYLYHGAKHRDDLYLNSELNQMQDENKNFYYRECIDSVDIENQTAANILDTIHRDLCSTGLDESGSYAFIAGSSDFVQLACNVFLRHGLMQENIFSDSFDLQDLRAKQADSTEMDQQRRVNDIQAMNIESDAKDTVPVDNEMWQALDYGRKLKVILDDFYSQVYQDDKLSGFFQNSTQRRSSEKQYLFMRQLFTGEKVFFGDRPKNAHHWMVISDELFDYREKLMIACLRQHGLADHLIQRWVALDESFRKDIVKDSPQPKIIDGVEYPLDGFDELELDVGSICDGCHQALEPGEHVNYHVRLGLIYCSKCQGSGMHKQVV